MTPRATAADYENLLQRARADENVAGVIVVGGHAAGAYLTPESDYDAYVVLRHMDESWATRHGSPVEVWPMTIDVFRDHAMPGSSEEWNRPAFLNARVDLDRLEGGVAAMVGRKATLEAHEARGLAERSLDAYINSLYRSLKNVENGRDLEGRLDALESISPLLTTAFAQENRVRPFNKWLRHELDRQPIAWEGLVAIVQAIARDSSLPTQRSAFNEAEPRARAAGLSAIVDGWEPDLAWLRGDR